MRIPDAYAWIGVLQDDANPNFLSNRDPESERIWQYFDQLQNTRPLQTVTPATPSCMTPSPPSKKISLGMTRTEQNSTQCTPIKVHPLLKEHLSLIREDICSLLPRRWVTNNETVLPKRNLDSFKEAPTVSYVGLGPHFGDDSRFFEKIEASMRKWWFARVCIDRHWWLYAFEISKKRLWVLDSMYTGEPNNKRLKIHAYAGRIIEDMAKVSIPAYEHTENGLPHFYPSVPKQHNGCDCGVFVIKFMQFWRIDKPLQHWDKEFRKEIILDIVIGPHNSEIGKALQALDSDHVHRNQPRKKTKAVRSLFTARARRACCSVQGYLLESQTRGEDNRRRLFE
ncbi:uncharacterized protein DS421_20g702920 [Arachis hypogaea]|nr:uncharacterized protein DS421_20g702920 [Arachis hypogaea]